MLCLWLQFAIQNVDYLQMTRNKPDFVWSVSASLCQPGICKLVQSCSKFSWWSVCWGSVYWGYCLQEVVHTKCFKVTRTRQYTSSFVNKNCADLLAVPLMYIFQDISVDFQYGGRLFFKNGSNYISAINWDMSTKFGLLIDFDLLKAATSTNAKPEILLLRFGRRIALSRWRPRPLNTIPTVDNTASKETASKRACIRFIQLVCMTPRYWRGT